MNRELVNVLILGAAFHFLFFSFQTSVFIQQTVVNSIKNEPNSKFTGDGYTSLCITYTVFALSNWLAPSVIALTGAKYGMLIGSITYVLYAASFIYPTTVLFYAAAALVGFGASPLWTGQGAYLAKNCDRETSVRYSGLFWSMFQSSLLFGNAFVYFAFNTQATISDNTRYLVYGVLTGVCSLGSILIITLRDRSATLNVSESTLTAWGQFCGALKLARTPDMLMLSPIFLFTGLLLSFSTGVYGTAIGATPNFGVDSKRFIGLSGVFLGIGEIFGGSLFGLLGRRVNRCGRDTTVVFGFLVTLLAFALIYVNLPPDASAVDPAITEALIEPRLWIAMLCSSLIGLGDACFNTQIYSLLMTAYGGDDSVSAFAMFKFAQSMGSAIAFFYSTMLNLHYQLCLMAPLAAFSTMCFCRVETSLVAKAKSISNSREIIVSHDGPHGGHINQSYQATE